MRHKDPAAMARCILAAYQCILAAAAAPTVSGKLVLVHRVERAAAARIAGAATLIALPDDAAARDAVRTGLCDFAVHGLDEAVRILRIEVRRGAPICVCLVMHFEDLLQQCVERGLQPDLLDMEEPILAGRGARLICGESELSGQPPVALWQIISGPHQGSTDAVMRSLDRFVAALLPPDDAARRGWLHQAPRVLGRQCAHLRLLPMHRQEVDALRLEAETLRALSAVEVRIEYASSSS